MPDNTRAALEGIQESLAQALTTMLHPHLRSTQRQHLRVRADTSLYVSQHVHAHVPLIQTRQHHACTEQHAAHLSYCEHQGLPRTSSRQSEVQRLAAVLPNSGSAWLPPVPPPQGHTSMAMLHKQATQTSRHTAHLSHCSQQLCHSRTQLLQAVTAQRPLFSWHG
jgi:hypothetical protein